MKNEFRSHPPLSLTLKIMAVFMAVMLPVYFLGMSLYLSGRQKMHDQIESAALAQVHLYSKAIESELASIQKLQYESINDLDTLYLVNTYDILNNYERAQYMLRAQNRLITLIASNDCIDSVTLHLIPIGKTITPFRIDPLDPTWQDDYAEVAAHGGTCMSYTEDGQICFQIQYPTTARAGQTPLLYMRLLVSNERIQRILQGFDLDSQSELCLVSLEAPFAVSDKQIGAVPETYLKLLQNTPHGTAQVDADGKTMQVAAKSLDEYGLYLFSAIPSDHIFTLSRQYGVIFYSFTILSIVLIIVFAFFLRRMVHKPIRALLEAFEMLEKGDLSVRITYNRRDEFQYLYTHFNHTVEHLKDAIDQTYVQKLAAQKAELKQLQSQIDPHFLYNSFYNIHRMAQLGDCDTVSEFTKYLSEYYQYITRNAAADVTMDREVAHARAYVRIQELRFGGNLRVRFDGCPDTFTQYIVPRLIVQPLLENAFAHGLKCAKQPTLEVTFFDEAAFFGVCVRDNGCGMLPEQFDQLCKRLNAWDSDSETSGLINTHRRLRLRFGSESGLLLQNSAEGLQVMMKIEKREKNVPPADR